MNPLTPAIHDWIKTHQSMVIAGDLPQAGAYAAPTCYVPAPDGGIYFFVFKDSEKHHLVTGDKPFCLVIDEGFQIPFQGLELRGLARVLAGEEAQAAQTALAGTFPKLGNVWGHPAVLVCHFAPQQALWHDWNVKVGHTETWLAEK